MENSFFLCSQTAQYQVKKDKRAIEIHSDLASGQQSTKDENKKEQLSIEVVSHDKKEMKTNSICLYRKKLGEEVFERIQFAYHWTISTQLVLTLLV